MLNFVLYLTPALIWGSTWLAIKLQLGVVDPMVSVGYRFILAAVILLFYCKITGLNLRYKGYQHRAMALQGVLQFGLNYWLVYLAELHLPSGVVSLVFSAIVFLNIFNSALFLGTPVQPRMLMSAAIGIAGIVFIFYNELRGFDLSSDKLVPFLLCLLSVVSTSFGDIVSARNARLDLPVVQSAGFGMLYASSTLLLLALIAGKPFEFDLSLPYVASLAYLAGFGSIVAFICYLSLLRRIGPGKSAYVALIFPIVALGLSTLFEGYTWTAGNFLGVVLILGGNFMIVWRPREAGDLAPSRAEQRQA